MFFMGFQIKFISYIFRRNFDSYQTELGLLDKINKIMMFFFLFSHKGNFVFKIYWHENSEIHVYPFSKRSENLSERVRKNVLFLFATGQFKNKVKSYSTLQEHIIICQKISSKSFYANALSKFSFYYISISQLVCLTNDSFEVVLILLFQLEVGINLLSIIFQQIQSMFLRNACTKSN